MFYVTRWLYYSLNHMNHLNYLKLKNCFLFFKFPITNICHVPRASHKSSDYVVFRAHCWNWKYWIFESQKYSKLLKNVEKERAAPRARSSRGKRALPQRRAFSEELTKCHDFHQGEGGIVRLELRQLGEGRGSGDGEAAGWTGCANARKA